MSCTHFCASSYLQYICYLLFLMLVVVLLPPFSCELFCYVLMDVFFLTKFSARFSTKTTAKFNFWIIHKFSFTSSSQYPMEFTLNGWILLFLLPSFIFLFTFPCLCFWISIYVFNITYTLLLFYLSFEKKEYTYNCILYLFLLSCYIFKGTLKNKGVSKEVAQEFAFSNSLSYFSSSLQLSVVTNFYVLLLYFNSWLPMFANFFYPANHFSPLLLFKNIKFLLFVMKLLRNSIANISFKQILSLIPTKTVCWQKWNFSILQYVMLNIFVILVV